jgi:hypothetical protein
MRQNLEIENIFFRVILFVPTTLSTGMTGISWHMQWPLTSQSHGSILKANNYFLLGIKLHALKLRTFSLLKSPSVCRHN